MNRTRAGFLTMLVLLCLTGEAFAVDGANYLVIAPDSYCTIVQPLADWKTEKGLPARVVPLSVTGSSATQIRDYIVNAYNTWPVAPEYVLIVGSPSLVPASRASSDDSYGDMEGDYEVEIPVGRFFATTTAECSTMVAKTLIYERTPFASGDSGWMLKGTTIIREDVPPDAYYQQDCRYVRYLWNLAWFTKTESLLSTWNDNSDTVRAAINEGRGFVVHRGQCVGNWWPPFNNVSPGTLTNGAKLPVVVSGSCQTLTLGSGETMLADQFVRAGTPQNLRGAVAYFGTSHIGSGVSFQRGTVTRGFFTAAFPEGRYHLGDACLRGKRALDSVQPSQYYYEEWNLLGDPELPLWTGAPVVLDVEHAAQVPVGPSVLDVFVTSSRVPVPGALVCVAARHDTAVYFTATTGPTGLVQFPLDVTQPDDTLTVTVTGHNLVPYQGIATITAPDVGATLIVSPGDSVDEFTPVYPQVRIANYGILTATCDLTVVIDADGSAPYDYTQTLTDLSVPAGDTTTHQCGAPWSATPPGPYQVWAYTVCPGDTEPSNDTVRSTTTVIRPPAPDVGVAAIIAPVDTIDSTTAVIPTAALQNYGQSPATFPAFFRVLDRLGGNVYRDSLTVTGLAPGAPTQCQFAAWTGIHSPGTYSVRCSTGMVADTNAANDIRTATFIVRAPSRQVPAGWHPLAPMPDAPSGKQMTGGAWLAHDALSNTIYAAKGNRTNEFFRYSPTVDSWTAIAGMPSGPNNKKPAAGSIACGDGGGRIYATKGGNTYEFYALQNGSWSALEDVPSGAGKKVKGGTGMVYVSGGDSVAGVYLLKGYGNEFYRFNPGTGRWIQLAVAPAGSNPKWDKGSWLAYDGANTIYAHKAKYSEFYAYDISSGTWGPCLVDIPLVSGYTGRSKKSKDGGSAAVIDGGIYALKGGNTNEFWRRSPGGVWSELETLPQVSPRGIGKRKKVNSGGSITTDGVLLYAAKGSRSNESWLYAPAQDFYCRAPRRTDGVLAADRSSTGALQIAAAVNPHGTAVIRYESPAAGPARAELFDVTGRLVMTKSLMLRPSGAAYLDLTQLGCGTYIIKLTCADGSATSRITLTR